MNVTSIVENSLLIEKRRMQLTLAGINVFSRLGFHKATVKDVAFEAGVSVGLVYQYVSDKQDLLFLALNHIIRRHHEEIPSALAGLEDPLVRLHAATDSYARINASNKAVVVLTYRETKSLKPEFIRKLKQLEIETNRLIEGCIQECLDAGFLVPTKPELLAYRVVIAAQSWSLKNWQLAKIVTLDEYIEHAIHACWDALLSQKGRRRIAKLQSDGLLKGLAAIA